MLKINLQYDLDRVFFNAQEFAQEIIAKDTVIKAIVSTKEEAIFNGELHTNIKTALINKKDYTQLQIKSGDLIEIDNKYFYINYIEDNNEDLVTLYISKNMENKF